MSCWVAIDAGGYHPPVTHASCVCELQSMPTNRSNCNSHLLAMDRTGAPTMPAETCTGALRRRLPKRHPLMAGPPGHKSRPSARRHTSLPGSSRRSARSLRDYPRKVIQKRYRSLPTKSSCGRPSHSVAPDAIIRVTGAQDRPAWREPIIIGYAECAHDAARVHRPSGAPPS